ncbi:MAG TPA: carbamoyltransferase HypF, partial [Caldithrix abyssi]|nr:carbamoyltransferase HypF [Caldithrix abyssi]
MADRKTAQSLQIRRLAIHINGIVQGVGFRPFIYNLAQSLELSGFVTNTNQGVYIEAQGEDSALQQFIERIRKEAPPLSEITEINHSPLEPRNEQTFHIRASAAQQDNQTLISPDVSICPDCLAELFDPTNRRYRYPFINCTNCGPRFTIIKNIPYDRPMTTMSVFTMCPACQKEYDDPADRRFHAQPNACPVCGPHLWYETAGDRLKIEGDEQTIDRAAEEILSGKIVAVKGLGGFHLAVDATNNEAVA